MADPHLVGDDVAVFVADGFDARDGETAVAQIVAGSLQDVVEIVLKLGGAFGRSEDAGIDTIGFIFPGLLEELNRSGIGGHADLGLVVEPLGGRGQNEEHDEDDGQVVLPATALDRKSVV